MQNIKESSYKVCSASAVTLQTVAKPAVKHSHKLMLEGCGQIEVTVNEFLDNSEKNTNEHWAWVRNIQLFKGLKKVNTAVSQFTKSSIALNYKENISLISSIESSLTASQKDYEEYFSTNDIKAHHNWVFSTENRKTIRELTEFIKDCTKDIKDVPYHKVLQYCMAFICIQKKARQVLWKPKIRKNDFLSDSINDIKYYCKYSIAIYGKLLVRILIENKWIDLFKSISEDEIFSKYVEIDEQELVYSNMVSRKYAPCHVVCVDLRKKNILVAIRGTMSLFDCMTDLQSSYEEFLFTDPLNPSIKILGKVHSGIMKSALNLDFELFPILLSCINEWPEFSIVITGHSLGAGTAALLGLIWKSKLELITKNLLVYAYGPPPVVSKNLNKILKNFVFSVIYGNDIIGRLSLGSLKDLATMIKIFYLKESFDRFSAFEIASKWLYGWKQNDLEILNLYNGIKKAFTEEKLQPPGNILQIYNKQRHSDTFLLSQSYEYIGKFINPNFYEEIVIDKTSFSDHMPTAYEEAILNLVFEY